MTRSCESCAILRVEMDRDTNELEHLAAAIVLVKGECDTLDERAGGQQAIRPCESREKFL